MTTSPDKLTERRKAFDARAYRLGWHQTAFVTQHGYWLIPAQTAFDNANATLEYVGEKS